MLSKPKRTDEKSCSPINFLKASKICELKAEKPVMGLLRLANSRKQQFRSDVWDANHTIAEITSVKNKTIIFLK